MASQPNGGQNTSVKDTVKQMKCDELIKALRKEIPDERYKADLQILEDERIDGELFLGLPDDPDLKEVFDKLCGGGKAKIRKVVRGINDGSLNKFGQADSGRKPVEPTCNSQDMPWCTTQTPNDTANGSGNGAANDGDMQRAWIPPDAVWPWKDKNEISVEFLHVDQLANWTTGDGHPMNTDTVLLHANAWSRSKNGGGRIPSFVEANNGQTAQIRVSFNNDKVCNSYLGKRAQMIQSTKPTMNLDLHNGCPSDDHKKYVIIHEFGHALGLGHEHQRSDFWRCIKPFTDIKKMKEDLGVTEETEEQFANDWKEIVDSETGLRTKEYDPQSIMHYLFKVDWLTHGYSDEKKVKEDLNDEILGRKAAEALLGVHQHCGSLPTQPSDLDIQLVKEAYDRENNSDSVDALEPSGAEKLKYGVELTNNFLSLMEWVENDQLKCVSIYEEASPKWREIGEKLGLKKGVLDSIEQDGRTVRDRGTKVLGKWYENACRLPCKNRYPKSWRGLINLLKDSDLGELAKEVHKALLHLEQSPN